jgi:hypothetical protein
LSTGASEAERRAPARLATALGADASSHPW